MSSLASKLDEFLNADRLRAWNHVLGAALFVCCAGYLALSSHGIDPTGKPIGTDFTSFYAASQLTLAGHPESAYDPAVHDAAENALFGKDVGYSAFFYPPFYLLICLPFALLPYLWSLAVWQGLTFAAYWRVIRRFAGPDLDLLAIATFPAVLINLGHGQNAFLSAALFGAGILSLNTRPVLAGVLLGCLAYKPQLGIVIPFALIAARRWETFAAAGATVLTLSGIATLAFGPGIWQAFVSNMPLAGAVLEQGLVDAYKFQSAYAAVRVTGGTHQAACMVQGIVSIVVLIVLVWTVMRSPKREIEPPVMALAALLASPYLLDYDLVIMAVPLAWLFAETRRTGFRAYEKIVMLAAFVLPLVARTIAMSTHVPLAPFVIAALMAVVVRRLTAEEGVVMRVCEPDSHLQPALGV